MIFLWFTLSMLLNSCNESTMPDNKNSIGTQPVSLSCDTVSELGQNIMVVYQDKKQVYWFGSHQSGLYRYDGKRIVQFTTKHGLPSNRIEEIKEDAKGRIFVNTSNGLCKMEGAKIILIKEAFHSDTTWRLGSEDLWFKSNKPGSVSRYDGTLLHNLKVPHTRSGEEYVKNNPSSIDPYGIYCSYVDSKGYVWFGTAVMGAFRYNGKSIDWIQESDVTEMHNGPSNGVRGIAEDADGNFWFNCEYRYKIMEPSQHGGKFYERIRSIGSLDEKGLLKEYLAITKDTLNQLWIATYRDGVWIYDGKKVEHISIQENSQNVLLFYIYKDRKGVIWLGTHEHGAWRWNGKEFVRFRK